MRSLVFIAVVAALLGVLFPNVCDARIRHSQKMKHFRSLVSATSVTDLRNFYVGSFSKPISKIQRDVNSFQPLTIWELYLSNKVFGKGYFWTGDDKNKVYDEGHVGLDHDTPVDIVTTMYQGDELTAVMTRYQSKNLVTMKTKPLSFVLRDRLLVVIEFKHENGKTSKYGLLNKFRIAVPRHVLEFPSASIVSGSNLGMTRPVTDENADVSAEAIQEAVDKAIQAAIPQAIAKAVGEWNHHVLPNPLLKIEEVANYRYCGEGYASAGGLGELTRVVLIQRTVKDSVQLTGNNKYKFISSSEIKEKLRFQKDGDDLIPDNPMSIPSISAFFMVSNQQCDKKPVIPIKDFNPIKPTKKTEDTRENFSVFRNANHNMKHLKCEDGSMKMECFVDNMSNYKKATEHKKWKNWFNGADKLAAGAEKLAADKLAKANLAAGKVATDILAAKEVVRKLTEQAGDKSDADKLAADKKVKQLTEEKVAADRKVQLLMAEEKAAKNLPSDANRLILYDFNVNYLAMFPTGPGFIVCDTNFRYNNEPDEANFLIRGDAVVIPIFIWVRCPEGQEKDCVKTKVKKAKKESDVKDELEETPNHVKTKKESDKKEEFVETEIHVYRDPNIIYASQLKSPAARGKMKEVIAGMVDKDDFAGAVLKEVSEETGITIKKEYATPIAFAYSSPHIQDEGLGFYRVDLVGTEDDIQHMTHAVNGNKDEDEILKAEIIPFSCVMDRMHKKEDGKFGDCDTTPKIYKHAYEKDPLLDLRGHMIALLTLNKHNEVEPPDVIHQLELAEKVDKKIKKHNVKPTDETNSAPLITTQGSNKINI